MSSENDVPLGEESRRYYEKQFGERIRQVSKLGAAPKTDDNNSNWGGKVGAGAILGVAFIIIRLVLFAARTDSAKPTIHSAPLPWEKPDAAMRERWDDDFMKGQQDDHPKRRADFDKAKNEQAKR